MIGLVRLLAGDGSVEHFLALGYRVSAYALMNLTDDVALLALVFC
jgi:hypothetical protein